MTGSGFDLIIRGGTVVDGTGAAPYEADIGVRGGRIVFVGQAGGRATEDFDARDLFVTPGFVDIHTHYDGQAIWSTQLWPSSLHGVTTVLAGNCGVGFAPCRAGDHDLLLEVMEGVEDIPEAVMAKGLAWDWETFPEYLRALESRPRDIDVATQLPHSALRVYAMGQRGADREPATPEDLRRMHDLTREALEAGALGFSSSRLPIHRTRTGAPVPSFEAAEEELLTISTVMKELGHGVLQVVLGFPDMESELELLVRVARKSGRPASFSLAQDNVNPDSWRRLMSIVDSANEDGCDLKAQVFPRPIGLLVGYDLSVNPFCLCPTYQRLTEMPLQQRVRELRRPEIRQTLLSEQPGNPTAPLAVLGRSFARMFPVSDPPNYEPPLETSIAAEAARRNIRPEELAYDLLLEDDGRAMLYVAIANYADGNLDAVHEMIRHRHTVLGLGDGGAHYGMISDASYPSFLLGYWTRDRKGNKLLVAEAIRALAYEPARAIGLSDRGILAAGYKADINVIDYRNVGARLPHVAYDLPAGGRRLMQAADGIVATFVSGGAITRNGQPTGSLPGKLLRGQLFAQPAA